MSVEDTNTFNCGCPGCRMGRGEITMNEYAWYLKGKIEARARDLLCKQKGKYGEFDPDKGIIFKSYEKELEAGLDELESELHMIVKDATSDKPEYSSKHKLEKVDPAFLTPRDYVCKECIKHG